MHWLRCIGKSSGGEKNQNFKNSKYGMYAAVNIRDGIFIVLSTEDGVAHKGFALR